MARDGRTWNDYSIALLEQIALLIGVGGGGTPDDDSVSTAKIQNDAVTLAKMANLATDRLLGRDTAGTGDPEALTVGDGIEFSGSGGLRLADGGTALAKLVDATAQYRVLGRSSSGSGDFEQVAGTSAGFAIMTAADAAAQRSALGFGDSLVSAQVIASTAAFSSTSTTPAAVTGWTFTPVAGGVYYVEWRVMNYTAATTTGMGIAIDHGNTQYGAAVINVRGASQSTVGIYNGAISGAQATGTSAPSSPTRVPANGWFAFKADATTPSAVVMQAMTEIGGSQVDIAAGDAFMIVRRIS